MHLLPCDRSTFVKMTNTSAIGALVMNVFAPLMTYESPSFFATVRRLPASLPAPGSDRPYAPTLLPVKMSGRKRCRTSSGPPISIAVPHRPAEAPITFQSDAFTRPACSIATQ
jgi:hypothetical protein